MNKYRVLALGIKGNQVTLLDEKEYETLGKERWSFDGKYAYHRRGKNKIYLHREIMKAPDGFDVDHVNGNPLDNRKENLRVVSHAVNMANRSHKNSNNKSGLLGVHSQKGTNKWRARIEIDGKLKHLGYFHSKVEAHKAYKKAVAERMSNVSSDNGME